MASGTEPAPAPHPGTVSTRDVLEEYTAKVRSFVDIAALRPLRVVADTANGMGGLVVPRVFATLPFSLRILFGDLDGNFPNHPADPIQPDNIRDLRKRVLDTGADVGLAFDGDADRCFLVDDQGIAVSGSTTTAIVAAAMLDKHPGSTILYNLICSKSVPDVIHEHGGIAALGEEGGNWFQEFGTPQQIGALFLTKFLLAFELASLLLLIAAVGAVILARRRGGMEAGPEVISVADVFRAPEPTGELPEGQTATMAEAAGTAEQVP